MACVLDNFEDSVVKDTVKRTIKVLSTNNNWNISGDELEQLMNDNVQLAIDNQIENYIQTESLCYEIIQTLDLTDLEDFGFDSVREAAEDGLTNYIFSEDIYVDILNNITDKVQEKITRHK